MKILLTNTELAFRAGSENWVLTMFKELSRYHEVDVFTCGANKLLTDYQWRPAVTYDLALINHGDCMRSIVADRRFKIKKSIVTCHGVIPGLEQPVRGADAYVSVSEEVRLHLSKCYGIISTIIRNPVNTATFQERRAVNPALRNILYLSNRRTSEVCVRQACNSHYRFKCVGGQDSVNNVEHYINWADLVVTLGRGIYESMACNRNVVVYDRNVGDGFIDDINFFKSREFNCSGRWRKYNFTPLGLREMFVHYDPMLLLRSIIMEHNDVRKIAKKYLTLASQL